MWTILGISDEVETCEQCGKTGLKRTVVLTDGDGERYVGTSCASTLTGIRAERVGGIARRSQIIVEAERAQEEWSTILGAMHYRFLKNHMDAYDEKKLLFGFTKVIAQTGLPVETIIEHLSSRWGVERVACLKRLSEKGNSARS